MSFGPREYLSHIRSDNGEARVAPATAKDLLKEAVEHLPENASVEEAMERLVVLSKIERGLADMNAGRMVTHEEVKRRLGM